MTQQNDNLFPSIENNEDAFGSNPGETLSAASTRAAQAVLAAGARRRQEEANQKAELDAYNMRSENWWDPNPSGLLNKGAAFVTGAARMAEDLAALPATALAGYQMGQVPEEAQSAYSVLLSGDQQRRELKQQEDSLTQLLADGKADPVKAATFLDEINAKRNAIPSLTKEQEDLLNTIGSDGESYRSSLDKATGWYKEASNIGNSLTGEDGVFGGIYNTRNREDMSTELGRAYDSVAPELEEAGKAFSEGDYLKGIGKGAAPIASLVVDGLASMINNPEASADYIIENIPQLIGGIFGKVGKALVVGSNVAFATGTYADSIVNLIENEGRLPSLEEHTVMVAAAVGIAAAETLGDAAILNKVLPKKAVSAADKAIKAATDTAKDGILKSIAKTTGKPVADIIKTGISELINSPNFAIA